LAILLETMDEVIAKFEYGYTVAGQVLTPEILLTIADIDGDGEITAFDARAILRAAIGFEIEDLPDDAFRA
ncbi:MAG: hypothetical protein K6C36_03270, partial [Clostridia bacterium]|nr:hypothetical protein [Clostridia bacterium]